METASHHRTGGGSPESFPFDNIEEEVYNILKGHSGPDINANIMEHGVASAGLSAQSSGLPAHTYGLSAKSPRIPNAALISTRNSASAQHTITSPQSDSSYHTASSMQTPRARLWQSRSQSPHNLPDSTARSTLNRARRNLTSTFNNQRIPSVTSPISSELPSPRPRNTSHPDRPILTVTHIDEYMKRNENRFERVLEYLAQIAQSSTEIASAMVAVSQNCPKRRENK